MTSSTQTIDFLPERYRQAKKRRHTSAWRLAVTLVFVVAFVGAAGGLYVAQRDVRRRSDEINKLFAAAQGQSSLLAAKQAELAQLDVYAEVVTHLRHPWPRSRIVAELFATLPSEVVIGKLQVHSVPRELKRSGESAVGETGENVVRTLAMDLADLQRQADEEDVVVLLEGTTRDQSALHIYLQSLTASKLFLVAELKTLEAATGDQAALGHRFTAVVKVRPAWGRVGGPQEDESSVAARLWTNSGSRVSSAGSVRS